MYNNIFFDRGKNRIHLWDSSVGYKSFPYKKYAFISDENGNFTTIFGNKVSKITSWTDDMVDKLYESDISPEMRTLIDLYYDSPDNEYPENNVVIIDIEVETSLSLPNVDEANNVITGISLYESLNNKYYSFIYDPNDKIDDSKIFTDSKGNNVILKSCLTEYDMLMQFLDIWCLIRPTIVTGWNIEFFDIPYIIHRMVKIVGESNVKKLSPIGLLRYSDFRNRYMIAGISILDYLSVYKKFTFSEEPSYRLDSIARKEVGRGKVEFEGSIQNLYENDIDKFIEYNINDVELVLEIDKKKKFIDLVIGISHKGRIPYEDIFYSSRYLEGAILCDLKSKNLVSPNKPKKGMESSFIGAYVKDPKVGYHEWVFDLDLTSLYPSIIMSLNISPETKIGKILDWNESDFISKKNRSWKIFNFSENIEAQVSTADIWNFLEVSKYYISSNGIIYQSKDQLEGVIPKILSKWFDERVEYKNLMKKFGKDKQKDKYDFYDRLQNIQKVLLNSFYGVLGLPIFRFYDLDNAASVTRTGQTIIKYSEQKGDEYFNNILKTKNNYCLAGDTDSVYFSAYPLLKHLYPDLDYSDEKIIITKVTQIVNEVQTYINNAYNRLVKENLNLTSDHRFHIKQELICRSGLWTAKKRYALKVVNREGILVDKLEVKGLDTVRSSFPPAFRGFMEKLLINILNGYNQDQIDSDVLDIESKLNSFSINEISKNTSINNITKYTDDNSTLYYTDKMFSNIKVGTPAHVRAAIAFNDLIKYYKLDNVIPYITSGEKIKWCYLKQNSFGITKIAFRGYDDPKEITDFIKLYIDRQEIYESELKSKIQSIYDAMGWQFPTRYKKLAQQFFKF